MLLAGVLDSEIAKVLAFYSTASSAMHAAVEQEYQEVGTLATAIGELVVSGLNLSPGTGKPVELHLQQLRSLSREVCEWLAKRRRGSFMLAQK